MAFLSQTVEQEEVLEGLGYRQQESRLCQQMKMASVSPGEEPLGWISEGPASCSGPRPPCPASPLSFSPEQSYPGSEGQPYPGGEEQPYPGGEEQPYPGGEEQPHPGSEQSKQQDSSRIRSRIPPNMPKLLIPSTITKFPPEITVTPPTPTLLSPKGSISEETKQKLKNVILASQSAANVKKETLCQPALEVQETSSQESSLESDTDEEDDYMDM
ncbi:hypothetical protein AAFF_G00390220 [Aldrovandia affinis]|uniref:Calcineurin-binding protein cabin-1 MEF2-binding domain-containing protein n=1 Tax=Aldrovandia affinis TaxID=143900 RepID=A0AAD7SEL4_9TELE|nr:hypothetical protein AAFF_G00390220 [Aldrovandia affinis]